MLLLAYMWMPLLQAYTPCKILWRVNTCCTAQQSCQILSSKVGQKTLKSGRGPSKIRCYSNIHPAGDSKQQQDVISGTSTTTQNRPSLHHQCLLATRNLNAQNLDSHDFKQHVLGHLHSHHNLGSVTKDFSISSEVTMGCLGACRSTK